MNENKIDNLLDDLYLDIESRNTDTIDDKCIDYLSERGYKCFRRWNGVPNISGSFFCKMQDEHGIEWFWLSLKGNDNLDELGTCIESIGPLSE